MYLDYSTGARNEPVEDVPRHPEVVPHVDALGGPHLELPLGGHHLQISIVCLKWTRKIMNVECSFLCLVFMN